MHLCRCMCVVWGLLLPRIFTLENLCTVTAVLDKFGTCPHCLDLFRADCVCGPLAFCLRWSATVAPGLEPACGQRPSIVPVGRRAAARVCVRVLLCWKAGSSG
uniref:Putative secreted protein n=1 Tax=Amblyomma parvum TaxID=251391 RepID=A0A023FZ32_AMBPA